MTISAQTSEKAAFWSKHIADWQVSGLRQKEYCAQHGLCVFRAIVTGDFAGA